MVDQVERVERVGAWLRRTLDAGLERVGAGDVEEVRELARTVHHARLVRLERELSAAATQLERYLRRDPSFSLPSWVSSVLRLDRLVRATAAHLAGGGGDADALLGVMRRTYEPLAGTIEVAALGASGWVSDSGFCGITVHLWDRRAARPWLASVARPVAMVGSDPRRLLFHPISEVTPLTVHELAHGAHVLDDVRVSSDGRLSLHTQLVAAPAAAVRPEDYRDYRCAGAAEVVDRIGDDALDVLGGGSVLVFVDGCAVREVAVDRTAARGTAVVVDPSGARLEVSVPLRPETDLLLENLARVARAGRVGLFGRAWLRGASVGIEPYTAVFDTPVHLSVRRSAEVQAAHLSIEPIAGSVEVLEGRRPARAGSPAVVELGAALGAIDAVTDRLVGGGLAVAHPGLADELGALAATWDGAGVDRAAGQLSALRGALGTPEAHGALLATLELTRAFRIGLGLEGARDGMAADAPAAPRVRGVDLVVTPVGIDGAGAVHGVAADGGYVVLLDLPGLFQAPVSALEVLQRTIVLTDHPIAAGGGRRVVRPAFHTAARSGERVGWPSLPRALVEAPAVAARDPAGWAWVSGERRIPVDDPLVRFELDKRSADGPVTAALTRVARDDGAVIAVDRRWPQVDPATTRWAAARLRARATDPDARAWVDALVGGSVPAGPAPAPDAEARRAAVVDGVARGGVLPSGAELWAVGAGLPGDGPPILRLGLPPVRLWLGCAGALAGWLRGDPTDARVRDALILAVGAGAGPVLVDGGSVQGL